MKLKSPFLLSFAFSFSALASDFPLDGGTRSFVDGDIINTFSKSDTLVVNQTTTVHALLVAGGGGGGTGVGGGGGGGGVV